MEIRYPDESSMVCWNADSLSVLRSVPVGARVFIENICIIHHVYGILNIYNAFYALLTKG